MLVESCSRDYLFYTMTIVERFNSEHEALEELP